jgi:pseudouridine-5'-phosphate glycosidase
MPLRIAPEVRAALDSGAPVVALESSVIAQGLPWPHNLESARACEHAVRAAGAVPATTAVVDGGLCVGVSSAELERLASGNGLWKVGSRDLAIAVSSGATGGTTVSATCELAARAGVRVFATGGLGGVHRGVAEDLDVSQDLAALARFPVAVVCAGAKSVLDLPKTLELLESLGVPVVGVGTRDFPAFYARSSGLALEHSVPDAATAAKLLHARFDLLTQSGVVLALPPPGATALDPDEVERLVSAALEDARAQRVQGKAVTPFLLREVARRSGGRTLAANLALLTANAAFAAEVAVAYAGLVRAD